MSVTHHHASRVTPRHHYLAHGASLLGHASRHAMTKLTHWAKKKKWLRKENYKRKHSEVEDNDHTSRNEHGQSFSTMRVVMNSKHHSNAVGSPIMMKEIYASTFAAGCGTQGFDLISCVGTLQQFLSTSRLGTVAAVPDYRTSVTSYLSLNPGRKLTGSDLLPATTTVADDKIILKDCNLNCQFTNMSTVACSLHIFIYAAKGSVDQNVLALWDVAQQQTEAAGITNSEGTQGGTFPSTSQLGYQSRSHPGNFPHHHASFRKSYELVGSRRFDMPGGASEELSIEFLLNHKFMLSQVMQQNATLITKDPATWIDYNINTARWVLGKSIQVVAISCGAVVQLTGSTQATYGATEIAWVCRRNVSLRAVAGGSNRLTVNLAQTGILAPAIADVRTVDVTDTVNPEKIG